ncbi:MAG: hypothetical protein M1834_001267 [Cirrosporium novae-zelandiae]|nr:MAG: hypothetical protein M1834_001267 [Cirrosporium novae-zelandiae]
MAPYRRKNLVASRRRVEDEGEEEEGSTTLDLDDDSLSEGSMISTADDDADGEGSDITEEPVISSTEKDMIKSSTNGHVKVDQNPVKETISSTVLLSSAAMTTDTEAMMNGLDIPGNIEIEEGISFEEMTEEGGEPQRVQEPQWQVAARKRDNPAERRRREHEDYKKKRDEDPAFVPNRGGFFMHDQRSGRTAGQNGFRSSRIQTKAAVPGPPNISRPPQTSEPTDVRWAHDLHEDISKPETPSQEHQNGTDKSGNSFPMKNSSTPPGMGPPRSFSHDRHIGNVQLRVLLPNMASPIIFSGVPVKQHTRLPNHRPPLRRDKPVRISLPDHPPRYIFPSMQRSFIFIPRALRPNQQMYQRGRNRGTYGGYGNYPSRRTSMYGGSVHTPSVAMSRRSSMGRTFPQGEAMSRTGSATSKTAYGPMDPNKPVVRLPPAGQQPHDMAPSRPLLPTSMGAGQVVDGQVTHSHPTPQAFAMRDSHSEPIPMHQPRPQKTVTVADLESPASLPFNPPQQQQEQPFHQQVPAQINGNMMGVADGAFNGQIPPASHPNSTPLPQIPERAVHAPMFQPYQYPSMPGYYPQPYPPQPVYYYPPPPTESPAYSNVPVPTATPFVPGSQPVPYMMPPAPPATEATGQSGVVAHESNGMVYYYDSSQQVPPPGPPYPPTSYNVHGMMTPPGGYYYPPMQGPVYYPNQQ